MLGHAPLSTLPLSTLPSTGAAEDITVDKWFVQPSEPPRRAKQLVQTGCFDIDASKLLSGELIRLDKWWQQSQDPPRRRRPIVQQDWFVIDAFHLLDSGTTTPTVDSWMSQIQQPSIGRKGLVQTGYFDIDASKLLSGELIRLDKWWQQSADPPRQRRPIVQQDWWVTDPFHLFDAGVAVPDLDTWYQQPSEPTRQRQPWARQGYFDIDASKLLSGELIRLDKWWQQSPDPPRPRQPLVREGQSVIDPFHLLDPEVPTLDKWWQQAAEPSRRRPRLRDYGWITIDPNPPAVVSTVWTEYGSPFLYTAPNWNAAVAFFLEAWMRSTGGIVRARLFDLTASAPVTNSEISTASGTNVRLRSSAVTFTDGNIVVAQFGKDSGATGTFRGAKIIGI